MARRVVRVRSSQKARKSFKPIERRSCRRINARTGVARPPKDAATRRDAFVAPKTRRHGARVLPSDTGRLEALLGLSRA